MVYAGALGLGPPTVSGPTPDPAFPSGYHSHHNGSGNPKRYSHGCGVGKVAPRFILVFLQYLVSPLYTSWSPVCSISNPGYCLPCILLGLNSLSLIIGKFLYQFTQTIMTLNDISLKVVGLINNQILPKTLCEYPVIRIILVLPVAMIRRLLCNTDATASVLLHLFPVASTS